MRWKELPASLGPDACRLVAELRRLKDHDGLTLKSLQTKTPFSSSSWERYLNGKVLPPPPAVEALAELAGEDPAPLLALLDAVAGADSSVQTSSESGPDGDLDASRVRVGALVLAVGALLLSAAISVLLLAGPGRLGADAKTESVTGAGKYTCTYTRRGGKLFAGNSSTISRLVMRNNTGPAAAEVQCLLLRHKLSPGDVDGYFGEQTETEVKRLQRLDHVPVDGVVGEQTWTLLRDVN
ncbi:peptidoglycan-binding protein [Streptomyces misionensis]|nr:peptidoglycan-binding protein [Streptomyces misionensis]